MDIEKKWRTDERKKHWRWPTQDCPRENIKTIDQVVGFVGTLQRRWFIVVLSLNPFPMRYNRFNKLDTKRRWTWENLVIVTAANLIGVTKRQVRWEKLKSPGEVVSTKKLDFVVPLLLILLKVPPWLRVLLVRWFSRELCAVISVTLLNPLLWSLLTGVCFSLVYLCNEQERGR